jgi:hypothetical protein
MKMVSKTPASCREMTDAWSGVSKTAANRVMAPLESLLEPIR